MVKAEVEKEQQKAKSAHANLLCTWSEKVSSDSDTEIEEIPPPKHSKTKSRNLEIVEMVCNNGNQMATTVGKLGEAISSLSQTGGSFKGEELEKEITKMKAQAEETKQLVVKLEEHVEETNKLLRELLSRQT
ncbi:hypothetical protein BGX38DRAFT_1274411 [Terfezia claveryi]|nr:hypothetical protein BGX38DRAFT_1274411 [Terfezia claveryi]